MARKKSPEIKQGRKLLSEAVKARKEARKEAERQLKSKVKILRSYVPELRKLDLRKKVSSKKKKKIEATYQELYELTNRPVKIFRSRNTERLFTAQKYSQHSNDKSVYRFNAAFVPSIYPDQKIKFTKNGIEIRSKIGDIIPIEFNLRKLAIDPVQEIADALAAYPTAKFFMIKTGKYNYNGLLSRREMTERVMKFMMEYKPGGEKYKVNPSGQDNDWNKWLFGVDAVNMPDRIAEKWYKDMRTSERDLRTERRKERNRQRAQQRAKLLKRANKNGKKN